MLTVTVALRMKYSMKRKERGPYNGKILLA